MAQPVVTKKDPTIDIRVRGLRGVGETDDLDVRITHLDCRTSVYGVKQLRHSSKNCISYSAISNPSDKNTKRIVGDLATALSSLSGVLSAQLKPSSNFWPIRQQKSGE